jgi:broad specificity phosphatase PhoE
MKLYLIRHGQSLANLGNWEVLEHIDTPLSDLGREQCEALRDWMRAEMLQADALYTSTLVRTIETAGYVEAALGMTAIRDDRIREIGHSFADGSPMSAEELPKSYISNHPGQDPYLPQTEGYERMETWMDARGRLGRFMRHLIANHVGQTVYVVCHAGIMAMMVENVLNTPPVRHSVVHTDNTGISHFEWEMGVSEMHWVLRWHNRLPHLPEQYG